MFIISFLQASDARRRLDTISSFPSPLTECIRVQCPEPIRQREHNPECHRDFSRRQGENEQEHDLAIDLSPTSSPCNECETCGIQHDFKRQQHVENVPSTQETDQTETKQNDGQ